MAEQASTDLLAQVKDIAARASTALADALALYKLSNESETYSPAKPVALNSTGAFEAYNANPTDADSLAIQKKTTLFSVPGYDRTKLVVTTPKETITIEFLIGVNSVSTSRTNSIVPNKTRGGWFMYRLGPGLMQMSFTGNLLDTMEAAEKANFLEVYKTYVEDQMDSNNHYENTNVISFYAKGYRYMGYITSLQINESSNSMFYASYTIGMIVIKDTNIFSSETAKPVPSPVVLTITPLDTVSNSLQSILTTTASTATE